MSNIIKARLKVKRAQHKVKQQQIEAMKGYAMTLCVCLSIVFATWWMR